MVGGEAARFRGAASNLDIARPPDGVTDDGSDRALGYVACDVAADASARAAVQTVSERHGRLDVVIANAGIGAQGTVADNSDDEWHRVLDVNVLGVARVVRAALPSLRRSPAAAVVVTCSIASWAGLPRRAVYSASKGALYALTLAMAPTRRVWIRVTASPPAPPIPVVARLPMLPTTRRRRAALEARQPMGVWCRRRVPTPSPTGVTASASTTARCSPRRRKLGLGASSPFYVSSG